jgi:hypothetical protein
MYKPSTYLVVAYFLTYLPTYLYMRPIPYKNWLRRWNQILTQLRFIHNWVIMGIQWMVRWWGTGSLWRALARSTLVLPVPKCFSKPVLHLDYHSSNLSKKLQEISTVFTCSHLGQLGLPSWLVLGECYHHCSSSSSNLWRPGSEDQAFGF